MALGGVRQLMAVPDRRCFLVVLNHGPEEAIT